MSKGKKTLMISGIIVVSLAVFIIISFVSILGKKTAVDYEIFNASASGSKVAVITDNTDYKMGIKNAIVDGVKNCCVEVYGLEDAKKVNANDYSLVVVMAPVYIGKLQTTAKNYIEKNKNSNLLLIITSESTQDIGLEIDAIATATLTSSTTQTPKLSYDEILNIINNKLG